MEWIEFIHRTIFYGLIGYFFGRIISLLKKIEFNTHMRESYKNRLAEMENK